MRWNLKEVDRVLYTGATWQSWKNQDYYLIGKKTDYSLFDRTHMYLWYGIKGTVDKKPSLMVISADGYMAVEIIETDLTKGGVVTVTLSDSTSVEGSVS